MHTFWSEKKNVKCMVICHGIIILLFYTIIINIIIINLNILDIDVFFFGRKSTSSKYQFLLLLSLLS